MTLVSRPAPVVTAVRGAGKRRIAVEVDGRPWRTVSVAAAAQAGLGVGVQLDRPRLRELARAVRKERALDAAGRALARRDLSRSALDERLARRRVAPAARTDALAALERAGLVDDERVAYARAAALAAADRGDAAIRWQLEREGFTAQLAGDAVSGLAPESERAATVVARRGSGAATARYLARRGFGEDAVEAAVGTEGGGALG